MAITHKQLISLGFKYAKKAKSLGTRKYDTLIFVLNKTDYLYLGYNIHTKRLSYKKIWKTFYNPEEDDTITYPIYNLGDIGFNELKDILERELATANDREQYYESKEYKESR